MHSENNEVIKSKLHAYEIHIDEFRSSVNKEGVWLFIATLGCWSVDQRLALFCALAITFILFTYRIYSKLSDKRPFSIIEKEIEENIRKYLDGDTQKARLHDLSEIKRNKHSLIHTFKSSFIFFLSYSFLALTAYYSVK
ncbi:hypothetical protein [Serratia oryzae]|uniref:hypothetical protein n=1 Tax=Serratia oryzae TaxID=2034155 RepID=UPI0009FB4ECC|nr:hypothetical protein [Serratia oryzae]